MRKALSLARKGINLRTEKSITACKLDAIPDAEFKSIMKLSEAIQMKVERVK